MARMSPDSVLSHDLTDLVIKMHVGSRICQPNGAITMLRGSSIGSKNHHLRQYLLLYRLRLSEVHANSAGNTLGLESVTGAGIAVWVQTVRTILYHHVTPKCAVS
jgi:hypothetical protein